ncbi:hypothetical protein PMI14_00961 [Acidovorax sp. CF316]|uniref:hypothetical protein n=1 Tax=Acidovorax sp. CF316 TaxID=1144317 RepID=UPI00026BBE94|nr:hypothetical protein [Acidovorax sp. CF316]EJE54149.1 hypothetical protein PMI14_00961 [Acidovorax sp. CF316]
MNIILENSEQVAWYTDVAATLRAMVVDPRDYDWYVSDVETNVSVPLLDGGDGWVTGDALADLLSTPIQFIWGVFSAFPCGARVEVSRAPTADGNRNLWHPPEPSPQLSGACFEVVCWDSSSTILVRVSQEQATEFLRACPDAKSLSSSWPK